MSSCQEEERTRTNTTINILHSDYSGLPSFDDVATKSHVTNVPMPFGKQFN